jgi:type II secretory pathway component PulK
MSPRAPLLPHALPRRARTARPRGTVLIVVIGIMIVLTGLVLVFSRQMRVEALASRNMLAAVQADAIVSGAALYVANRLANNTDQTLLDSEISAEAVPVGEGFFWILRPNPDDERQYAFGVVGEASKLNINSANLDMLLALSGMTPDLAGSIVDWRDADSVVSDNGAENEYYLLAPEPYYCKNAPFESVEEIMLVRGASRELLHGVDLNRNGVLEDAEAGHTSALTGFAGQMQCGLAKYLTVFSVEPSPARRGPPLTGRINVNTAPREVLRCLPGLSAGDVDLLIAKRSANGPDLNNISWVTNTLPVETVRRLTGLITTRSLQFSADIVGVSANGRAFKRVKYVFDLRTGIPRIIFCQDLTHLGWPLSPALRDSLRAGTPATESSTNTPSLGRR